MEKKEGMLMKKLLAALTFLSFITLVVAARSGDPSTGRVGDSSSSGSENATGHLSGLNVREEDLAYRFVQSSITISNRHPILYRILGLVFLGITLILVFISIASPNWPSSTRTALFTLGFFPLLVACSYFCLGTKKYEQGF